MLSLLLCTRLRYYYNYLRHHFDRMVWLEIGVIILLLLYLTGRSPADIGYNLTVLLTADFPAQFLARWITLLPLFYLIAETSALFTLRPTGEWRLLGALPLAKREVTNYHLLRHLAKTGGFILLGTLPLWSGRDSLMQHSLRFLLALGLLLTLQWAGFAQAFRLQNAKRKLSPRLLFWLLMETVIFSLLIFGASPIQSFFAATNGVLLLGVVAGWGGMLLLWFYIHHTYEPSLSEAPISKRGGINFFKLPPQAGVVQTLIWRDFKFLWSAKRARFAILFFAAIILGLACFAQAHAEAAYASSIVIEIILGFVLINALLVLFEHDVQSIKLLRTLSIHSRAFWKARWLLAGGFVALPMLLPILLIPFKFSISAGFFFFVMLALLLPGIFAALYCNAGFGLFPNLKYCGVLLNILLGLIILFWFYMPLGSIILLALSVLWIRKSQRHFQFWEVLS